MKAEAMFTTTERRRIGQRIGGLHTRLGIYMNLPSHDLDTAEHLIIAARGGPYRIGQVALDYWDGLTDEARNALLVAGERRRGAHREQYAGKQIQRAVTERECEAFRALVDPQDIATFYEVSKRITRAADRAQRARFHVVRD